MACHITVNTDLVCGLGSGTARNRCVGGDFHLIMVRNFVVMEVRGCPWVLLSHGRVYGDDVRAHPVLLLWRPLCEYALRIVGCSFGGFLFIVGCFVDAVVTPIAVKI